MEGLVELDSALKFIKESWLLPGLRHLPHKLERPSAALALPAKSDLRLVGHGRGGGGCVIVIPARHGRGRLPPHPGADDDAEPRHRLPPLLQLARDQNQLEIPGIDHTMAKAFQFSHTE